MKQIKNFGKALLGLVMPVKHQPLTDGWLKQNDKEIKNSVKSSAFIPPHFKKFNTTVKNEFKPINITAGLTTEQKLKKALADLDSQPGFGKWEKSDKEYIKCDGTGTITHRDDVYYYAPSNIHLSKKFFKEVTKEQLQNDFDIDGDDEFRGWFLYTLLKIREE
jgi:hypothetical protein